MRFLDIYNSKLNTILYSGHGQNTKEYKLTQKWNSAFNTCHLTLKTGSNIKPVYISFGEYDADFEEFDFVDSLRFNP